MEPGSPEMSVWKLNRYQDQTFGIGLGLNTKRFGLQSRGLRDIGIDFHLDASIPVPVGQKTKPLVSDSV